MCSVIGYKGIFNEQIVKKLLYNSRIRGIHAFGYSFYSEQKLITKKFIEYKKFEQSLLEDKPSLFIAHFRYSTSGDYKIIENNQPLLDNDIAIAFNGVISQKTKEEIEQEYNVKLKSDNDGYLLINRLEDKEFLLKKNISYALVGLKEKKLFCIRNKNRPLHLFEDKNLIIIASTKDILKRSGINNSIQLLVNKMNYYG
jgi:glutamine phosphoribosylpyrophosphate amidotransferase